LWTVAYDNRGTKAVLLKNGRVHRELNRSYYFAKEFDYPLAIAKGPADRALLVHCPNEFNILALEDAETGAILGTKQTKGMEFHSRLEVSKDGKAVLSAGWFWHPLCGAWICSLTDSAEKIEFGHKEMGYSFGAEIDGAAFLGNDRLVVSTGAEVVDEDIPATGLGPKQLGVWSIAENKWSSTAQLAELTGILMPWRDWVISFYDHPKAIELATGSVVHRWDNIYSGRQVGAIEIGTPPPPVLALDSNNGRFAVSGPEGVTIVTLRCLE
jgi:hypothetical protein